MSKLGTLVSDFKKDAEKVKLFVEKIGSEAPTIVQDVVSDEEKIAPVIEAFVPGAATAINLGNSLLDTVAQAVEDLGTAAGSNAINVSFDQKVVADVKALIAAAKAAAAKGSPAPAVAS
jgi:hypothetical protein